MTATALLVGCAAVPVGAAAQQKINPATQINWPSNCNSGVVTYNFYLNTCVPAGAVSFTGAWNSSTAYAANQAVSYNGSQYVSLVSGNVNQNPATAPADWALLVGGNGSVGSGTAGQFATYSSSGTAVSGHTLSGTDIANAVTTASNNDTVIVYPTIANPNPGGDSNTIVGAGSGVAITSAREMTIFGQQAVSSFAATAGWPGPPNAENGLITAIGSFAGHTLTNGLDMTLVGQKALANATFGSAGVMIGNHAGTGPIYSQNDTFVGDQVDNGCSVAAETSLFNTIVGAGAVGGGCGSRSQNVVVGALAMGELTTGSNNIALGTSVGTTATTASNNIVIGGQSATSLVGGTGNIFIGTPVGPAVDTSYQIAIGAGAGQHLTGLTGSTLVGTGVVPKNGTVSNSLVAGFDAANGSSAIALQNSVIEGTYAGTNVSTVSGLLLIGYGACQGITTGSGNICLGEITGGGLSAGTENTILGDNAGAALTGSETGNIMIGAGATVASGVSNAVQIGSSTNNNSGTAQIFQYKVLDNGGNLYAPTSLTTPTVNQTAANSTGGTCTMASGTSCSFNIGHVYATPICIATVQSATLTGASMGCTVSGNTVTINAAAANSLTWGAFVFGNPN